MGEFRLSSLHFCEQMNCSWSSSGIAQDGQHLLHIIPANLGKGESRSAERLRCMGSSAGGSHRASERCPFELVRLEWCSSHHRPDLQRVLGIILL